MVIEDDVVDVSGLPAGFVWGVATAAPAAEADAVATLHDLGVDAYRLPIAWPRVQPGGAGPLDAAGLGFYDRLVDLLLDAGVQPWATLYHGDLPPALYEAGGWAARDTADRFADYATAVHAALGDRVRHWVTLDAPSCSAQAAHHLLLAHGRAVRGMREQATADHRLGIVLTLSEVADGSQDRFWLDAVLEEIAAPLDLLGVVPAEVTATGVPVSPDALRGVLQRVHAEYSWAPPLVVTATGVTDDPADHLVRQVRALVGAVRDGADVRGYFASSPAAGVEAYRRIIRS